ncbi:response regulator [Azohydromonas australica]|uniref:response regulator n=1 Tax=Azohydromonas australica TaxID=364039 RepID=UPI0009FC1F3B|nr:response regulator [Azohydromonas australica]
MHKDVSVRGCTTVVYIEPDRTNALLMKYLLDSRADYILHRAKDGSSGLELCRQVSPDLVVTEMHLPDMVAYDILQALRADPATQGLPCIVFSGDAMPDHIKQALDSGFDDYWVKPIDIWRLLQNIDDVASRRHLVLRRKKVNSKPEVVRLQESLLCFNADAALMSC